MSDLISRVELFNRLATVHAPAEANDYKTEVFNIINNMPTVEREKNEHYKNDYKLP